MRNIALISFLNHSINVRTLTAYARSAGYDVVCVFVLDTPNDMTAEVLIEFLKDKNIEMAGFSLVTDDYPSAVFLTEKIKQSSDMLVIWGGAHVNVMPEESLNYADMICMGEGEDAFLELLQNFDGDLFSNTSIKNFWFKTKDGIVRNCLRPLEEDLDKYPFPENDRDSMYVLTNDGVEQFTEKHLHGVYNIMTSRGCPYQCDYCYNSYRKKQYQGLGRYLRMRSIGNVIEELMQALKLFPGLKYVQFWDDCFTARAVEELRLFKKLYNNHIRLPFFALIEPMIFDPEKIKLLKECGLQRLQVGIQTGSERLNSEIFNRKASNKKVLEMAKYINELGIEVVYDLIFNNPYETIQDIKETINLLLQFPRPLHIQGYSLIFYPGTRITERALEDGHISYNNDLHRSLTIQSKKNSPISMKGAAEISDRFYKINYSSDNKLYWNSVVSSLASNHFPRALIRFFGRSDGPFKQRAFKAFIRYYAKAASLKHRKIFNYNKKLS